MKTYKYDRKRPIYITTDVAELHKQLLTLIDKLNMTDESTDDYKVFYSHMKECRTELGVKSAKILLDMLQNNFIEVKENL